MSEYKETFFIVPTYISELDGMTLGYLKVFNSIFQFWNKGKICFLNNQTISERTGLKIRQVQNALDYFEKKGELLRTEYHGKRHLIQPTKKVEIEDHIPEQKYTSDGRKNPGRKVLHPSTTCGTKKKVEIEDHIPEQKYTSDGRKNPGRKVLHPSTTCGTKDTHSGTQGVHSSAWGYATQCTGGMHSSAPVNKEIEIKNLNNNNTAVVDNLLTVGEHKLSNKTIEELNVKYGIKSVSEQLDRLKTQRGIHNPTGWLISALRGSHSDSKGQTIKPMSHAPWSLDAYRRECKERDKMLNPCDWREQELQRYMAVN